MKRIIITFASVMLCCVPDIDAQQWIQSDELGGYIVTDAAFGSNGTRYVVSGDANSTKYKSFIAKSVNNGPWSIVHKYSDPDVGVGTTQNSIELNGNEYVVTSDRGIFIYDQTTDELKRRMVVGDTLDSVRVFWDIARSSSGTMCIAATVGPYLVTKDVGDQMKTLYTRRLEVWVLNQSNDQLTQVYEYEDDNIVGNMTNWLENGPDSFSTCFALRTGDTLNVVFVNANTSTPSASFQSRTLSFLERRQVNSVARLTDDSLVLGLSQSTEGSDSEELNSCIVSYSKNSLSFSRLFTFHYKVRIVSGLFVDNNGRILACTNEGLINCQTGEVFNPKIIFPEYDVVTNLSNVNGMRQVENEYYIYTQAGLMIIPVNVLLGVTNDISLSGSESISSKLLFDTKSIEGYCVAHSIVLGDCLFFDSAGRRVNLLNGDTAGIISVVYEGKVVAWVLSETDN